MEDGVLGEVGRRAWAVEQAVHLAIGEPDRVLALADSFLAYVSRPLILADARLVQAARDWNGGQDAGALIGLLADALERR